MIKLTRSAKASIGVVALSVLLASCGGGSGGGVVIGTDSQSSTNGTDTGSGSGNTQGSNSIDLSDASLVTEASKVSGSALARTGRGFSFPSVNVQNGAMSMVIPNGELPKFPARRTIVSGTGQTIEFGDAVTLKYDMFAWSDGTLVESSSLFEEAHTVQGGISDDFPIPEYLAKSLLGRRLGDTIQVVLPVGTADLPPYLDANDAYILMVELL